MSRPPILSAALLTAGCALLASAAAAQTLYRYVDSSGAVHYSDKPLLESTGRQIDRLTKGGTHIAPGAGPAGKPGDPTVLSEAEKARRKAQTDLEKIEERRNYALLATYNSLKEIDDAQDFATRDPRRELRDAQTRMIDAGRRREALQTQVEGLGGAAPPAELRQQLVAAELEFKNLAVLVEGKRRDMQTLNDRFEEDRRRYRELMARRQALIESAAAATPVKN